MSAARMLLRALGVVLWHVAPVPVDGEGRPASRRPVAVMASIDHVGT